MDRTTSKRRAAAAQAFLKEIQGCSDLQSADLIFEPKNFAAWMHACDTGDRLLVQSMYDRTWTSLRAAEDSGRAGRHTYVKLRTHFVNYAREALARRWPTPASIDVVDGDLPF